MPYFHQPGVNPRTETVASDGGAAENCTRVRSAYLELVNNCKTYLGESPE